MKRAIVLLLGATLGLPLASRAEPAGPVFDVLWGDARETISRDDLIARAMPAPDEPVRVVEIGRDATTSHHVVAIRGGETPHRHDRHDLVVVLLRGHGTMRLGDDPRPVPVGEGSVLYVPRGAVHAFTNGSDAPAFAHVVYTPPFDGEDRVPVGD